MDPLVATRPETPCPVPRRCGLSCARAGDAEALNALFDRFGPELRRFARGRLPRQVRGIVDTPDIVQETLLQTFTHLSGFDDHGEGALRADMRQILVNRIRDEIRRAARRPAGQPVEDVHADTGVSPLEAAIGREGVDRYETALAQLKDEDRDRGVHRARVGQRGSHGGGPGTRASDGGDDR